MRPGLPKLIATDLDGTLVRSDDTVSAYSHEVLGRVAGAGIPIVGVTGRGPRIIELCRRDIPEAHYLVLAQGARVVDLTDPRGPVTLRAETVAGALVAGVIEALEAEVNSRYRPWDGIHASQSYLRAALVPRSPAATSITRYGTSTLASICSSMASRRRCSSCASSGRQ